MEKLSGIEWNTFPLSSVTAGSGTIYQLSYIFMASRNGTRFIDYFSCFQRGYFLFLPSFTFISFQYFPAPSPLTENTLLASSLKSHFLLFFQCFGFGLASFYSCSTEHKTEIGSERPPIYKALVLWGNSESGRSRFWDSLAVLVHSVSSGMLFSINPRELESRDSGSVSVLIPRQKREHFRNYLFSFRTNESWSQSYRCL